MFFFGAHVHQKCLRGARKIVHNFKFFQPWVSVDKILLPATWFIFISLDNSIFCTEQIHSIFKTVLVICNQSISSFSHQLWIMTWELHSLKAYLLNRAEVKWQLTNEEALELNEFRVRSRSIGVVLMNVFLTLNIIHTLFWFFY